MAGPDGNLWFTESAPGKIGMINPATHAISEFSAGLNPGSVPGASIVVGPDGALWFMDGGTTQAIGRIDPTTHAISEFSSGLNPGAGLGRVAVGPDGNLWFGDKGATRSIYMMNPTTHAITGFHQRSERRQRSGWHLDRLGRERLVHRPGDHPTTRRSGESVPAPPPRRSHHRT